MAGCAGSRSRYPSNPVTNGETSIATDPLVGIPAGFIDTFVSSDGLTIRNRTQRLHVFYDGTVERTATRNADGSWVIRTHGLGNNRPGLNPVE